MIPYILSAAIIFPLSILWFGLNNILLGLFVAFISVFSVPLQASGNRALDRPPIGQGIVQIVKSLGVFLGFVAFIFVSKLVWALVTGSAP